MDTTTHSFQTSSQFAHDVLAESGHAELFEWVDDSGKCAAVVKAITLLAVQHGGVVEGAHNERTQDPTQLNALIGKGGWHVNISTASWKLVITGTALSIAILKTLAHDPTGIYEVGVALVAMVDGVRDSVLKLDKAELEAYLAVKAATLKSPAGATFDEIAVGIPHAANDLQRILDRLTVQEVLEEDGKYRCK